MKSVDLLTVEQAMAILDAAPLAPRVLELPLEQAQGLALAQIVRADRDYPPFDKSCMDGFAVRSADVAQCPAELAVVGELRAGQLSTRRLGAGQTMAIMTGAPLPAGADAVVPVEQVEPALPSAPRVRVLRGVSPGQYVARAGSDGRAGDVVLRAGQMLESPQLAAAAMVGQARIRAFAAPRAAILVTGDEIVPFGDAPGPAQIRNSNSLMLAALLRRLGCSVMDLGIAPDTPESIRAAVAQGLKADALFVAGGMSRGRYDHVPQVLRELGVDLKMTGLRLKPGKPFVFGIAPSGCPVFGLPGNPVSGFVCTLLLASRVLKRLAGGAVSERWLTGPLATPLPANGSRESYQPVRLDYGHGLTVHPLECKGSADLFTLAAANALLRQRENEPALPAGSMVSVMALL